MWMRKGNCLAFSSKCMKIFVCAERRGMNLKNICWSKWWLQWENKLKLKAYKHKLGTVLIVPRGVSGWCWMELWLNKHISKTEFNTRRSSVVLWKWNMRPWSQGPTSPAGMGWMQLLWNAAAHPQGSPGPTEVDVHGWRDPKMSLRATSSWSSLPPPSYSFSLQGKMQTGKVTYWGKSRGKENQHIQACPYPCRGQAPHNEGALVVAEKSTRLASCLVVTQGPQSVPTTRAGYHLSSGCLPPSFAVLGTSVCKLGGWHTGRKHLRDTGLLLKTRRYFWSFTNKRPCCLCIIFSRCPNTNRFPFSIWGKIIKTHKAQPSLKTKEIKIMEL